MSCQVEGCGARHLARGLCQKHYYRQKRGQSLTAPSRYDKSDEQRFFEKTVQSGDCWLWTGSKDGKGYGHFRPRGSDPVKAHRWAYEFMVDDIPKGLTIDHLCERPGCVNPHHLDPVPREVNTSRARRR